MLPAGGAVGRKGGGSGGSPPGDRAAAPPGASVGLVVVSDSFGGGAAAHPACMQRSFINRPLDPQPLRVPRIERLPHPRQGPPRRPHARRSREDARGGQPSEARAHGVAAIAALGEAMKRRATVVVEELRTPKGGELEPLLREGPPQHAAVQKSSGEPAGAHRAAMPELLHVPEGTLAEEHIWARRSGPRNEQQVVLGGHELAGGEEDLNPGIVEEPALQTLLGAPGFVDAPEFHNGVVLRGETLDLLDLPEQNHGVVQHLLVNLNRWRVPYPQYFALYVSSPNWRLAASIKPRKIKIIIIKKNWHEERIYRR